MSHLQVSPADLGEHLGKTAMTASGRDSLSWALRRVPFP